MKKTIFFAIALLSLSSKFLYAQDNYTTREINDLIVHLDWNKTIHSISEEIQGSPYLNEEFMVGEVYYDGKYKVTDLPLRYNLYNDEIEYKDNNTPMAIAQPDKIDKVIIGKNIFIYIKKNSLHKVSGFVRIWNDESPSILTKMKVAFFEKEPPKAIVESKPARFERKYDIHYLMKSPEEIEKIKSVKKLIQSLGNHEKELTDFAKKEKISSRNPAELAKLLDHYHGFH